MKLLSRNPDKPKKQLETTIGKIIYGFLLFMPLLSILVTCMYVTLNKNAYQSYSDYSIYQEIKLELNETMQTDLTYNIRYKNNAQDYTSIYISYISYTKEQLGLTQAQYDTIYLTQSYQENFYIYYNYNGVQAVRLNINEVDTNIQVSSNQQISEKINSTYYVTRTILTQNKLDNVFTYSIKKVEENNLWNWAKNTGTYDVLLNTTTLLGIENTFIPMLMAYWLLISVIYFIYDIALMLIMVVHRKIHELQESI